MRCRGVVALLRPRRGIRAGHLDDHAPPGPVALLVLRRIADGVLARQLVRYLRVDAREILEAVREERTAAGFLGELTHDEFRLAESLGLRRFGTSERNRINRCFRTLRELE